jgi:hypothetical protein
MIMKKENQFWMVMSIYAVFIIAISIMLSSCGSGRSCHTKGVYVSKSIKKAQSKPRSH